MTLWDLPDQKEEENILKISHEMTAFSYSLLSGEGTFCNCNPRIALLLAFLQSGLKLKLSQVEEASFILRKELSCKLLPTSSQLDSDKTNKRSQNHQFTERKHNKAKQFKDNTTDWQIQTFNNHW